MMKKMKLADVPFGKNFEIWGHAYTVLDGDDKGVFVLEADAVCEMPFREKNAESESAPNNFWDSSVRAYLEGDYLEELVEAGAELDRDILEMELDLKCTSDSTNTGWQESTPVFSRWSSTGNTTTSFLGLTRPIGSQRLGKRPAALRTPTAPATSGTSTPVVSTTAVTATAFIGFGPL